MRGDRDAQAPHEVVIVRRRNAYDNDDRHGGAWKIAFADLMTAMMALFLVLWLVNVSDTEKVHKIATYFNPMKLNATESTEKGLQDPTDDPASAKAKSGNNVQGGREVDGEEGKLGSGAMRDGGVGSEKEGAEKRAEEELFNDPYGVLARLALEAELADEAGGGGKNDALMPGGDTYSNPFEPFSQRKAEREKPETLAEPSPLPPEVPGVPKLPDVAAEMPAAGQPGAQELSQEIRPAETPAAGEIAPASEAEINTRVSALAEQLQKALQAFSDDRKPRVEVTAADDGVLISLTDDFRFGMFATSSAKPTPELVVVMEKVAKVLADQPGELVIRGHTDGRQYRTQRDNNWRLSLSRAQIAYHMLVRGGITEARVSRIEGHADRDLKIPDDPYASQNRRIEILLRLPKT